MPGETFNVRRSGAQGEVHRVVKRVKRDALLSAPPNAERRTPNVERWNVESGSRSFSSYRQAAHLRILQLVLIP
jgi:hypothetical protein